MIFGGTKYRFNRSFSIMNYAPDSYRENYELKYQL